MTIGAHIEQWSIINRLFACLILTNSSINNIAAIYLQLINAKSILKVAERLALHGAIIAQVELHNIMFSITPEHYFNKALDLFIKS